MQFQAEEKNNSLPGDELHDTNRMYNNLHRDPFPLTDGPMSVQPLIAAALLCH